MAYFSESNKEFSVSVPQSLNERILKLLIRNDGQEDLLFGFWYPSYGLQKNTALIQSIIPHKKGDRKVHGNVSFNYSYFKRVCELALKTGCGVVFMHSHPFPGWQFMSNDDILAETKMAPTVDTITKLPLIGMTVGSDGIWSARVWSYNGIEYLKKWIKSVKVIGFKFNIYFDKNQIKRFSKSEYLKRTVSIWGKENQEILINLKIGIVGLGSVGSIVVENLARMGIQNVVLIDFDKIEKHNLDRIIGTNKKDIGKYKVDVMSSLIKKSSPFQSLDISRIKMNIADKKAYQAILDCDFIFCCADKPRARYILNHIAYSHLIPVINGGILAELHNNELQFADWEVSLVTPDRPCMQCLKAYSSADVMMEKENKLNDPNYIKGLSSDNLYKQNQNVIPFSMNLASLEVLQFIAYITGIANLDFYGVQRYRFKQAFLSNYLNKKCNESCDYINNVAFGDKLFCPI